MAARYWVGGTGTWDTTTTTHWSATSGGAGGASAPTAADDVILDGNSGTGTVTTAAGALCRSLDCTGYTGTLAFANSATALTVGDASGGAFKLSSGMTVNVLGSSSVVTFVSTSSNGGAGWPLQCSGKQVPGILFNGAFGKWSMQDALDCNGGGQCIITMTNGELVTNGYFTSCFRYVMNGGIFTAGTSDIRMWDTGAVTLLNITGGFPGFDNARLVVMLASTNNRTIAGNSNNFGELVYNVADSVGDMIVTGNNLIKTVTVGPGRKLTLTANLLHVDTFALAGEDRDYVYCATSGSTITTPDNAALDATTEFELVLRVACADWTPSGAVGLLARSDGSSANSNYMLGLDGSSNGKLRVWASGGTFSATSSTAATGFTDGTAHWIKVTWRKSDGRTQFFTANDASNTEPSSWTQLGTDVTFLSGATLVNSSLALSVGDNATGWTKVYRAIVRTTIGGTAVADFDADKALVGANSYTDPAGRVWTKNLTAKNGDGRVILGSGNTNNHTIDLRQADATGKRMTFWGDAHTRSGYLALDGTGDYVSTPDHADLDITSDLDIIVRCRLTDWTPAGAMMLLGKEQSTTQRSYRLFVNSASSGTLGFTISNDGSAFTSVLSSVATGFTDNTDHWVRVTWRQSDGRVQFFTGTDDGSNNVPKSWTQLGSDRTLSAGSAIFSSSSQLELGARIAGTVELLNGRIHRAIVKAGIDGTTKFDADFAYYNRQQVFARYLVIDHSTVIGNADWYADRQSGPGSGNVNWNISAGWYIPTAQTTETDSASVITPVQTPSGHNVDIGKVTETDSAQTITASHSRVLGQPAEADSASTIGHTKARAVAAPTESDSAQSIAARRSYAIAAASETDTAQSIAHAKARAITAPSEADTSGTVTPTKRTPIAAASESDTAGAIAHSKARGVTVAVELDAAQLVTPTKQHPLLAPVETDAARPLVPAKAHALTQPAEADSALPIGRAKALAFAGASEADSARTFTVVKLVAIGQAVETDSAGSATVVLSPIVVGSNDAGVRVGHEPRSGVRRSSASTVGVREV